MYRRSRFLIGFLAAALTFGGLMATIGPEHFHRSLRWHHRMGNCGMYYDRMNQCDEPDQYERHERYEQYRMNEGDESPMQEMKTDSVKK